MLIKSKKGFMIGSIPYPRITRYMGTYLIALPRKEVKKAVEISARNKCPIVDLGKVEKELRISIGGEVVVDRKKMQELIRGFPYRKAKL